MLKRSDLLLSPGKRLWLLLCLFILGYAVTAVLSLLLVKLMGSAPAMVRISTVMQDILVFILPAVATACIICRRPAELLCLTVRPTASALTAVGFILFASIPAMEAIIRWNDGWHFPESLAALESSLRQMEETASAMVETLLRSNTSVAALVLNILIIGVAAGVSEEILFRGCFQRLLTTSGVNPHAAIWIVAIVFSTMHFQIFGFVPRMLLGAYFGYLLFWTRSIWVPILAHTLNNSIYVAVSWLQLRNDPAADLSASESGDLYSPIIIALSALATAAALWWVYIRHKSLPPVK